MYYFNAVVWDNDVQSQTVNREKKNIDMCEMIYTHTTLLIYFDAFPVLQIMKYL